MKGILTVALLSVTALAQTVYSGSGVYSGISAFAGGVALSGPPNYAGGIHTANVVNVIAHPSWGPNTCDWTSFDTLMTCGNVTGANTCVTPGDYGNQQVCRVTDANTLGAATVLGLADDGMPNLWKKDSTAFIFKSAGGTRYIAHFDPVKNSPTYMHNLGVSPISLGSNPTVWSKNISDRIYQLVGTQMQYRTVTLNSNPANDTVSAATTIVDFATDACLGSAFPQNGWTGVLMAPPNDDVFIMGFSSTATQGTGAYAAYYQVSTNTCGYWNTDTGQIYQNGALLGTINCKRDAAGDCNSDNFFMHEMYAGQGGTYALVNQTAPPNWIANHTYASNYRINPGSGNAGDYVYKATSCSGSCVSGGSAPTWNQTPGSTVIDNTITWTNTGGQAFQGPHVWQLGTTNLFKCGSTPPEYCDGHFVLGASGIYRSYKYHPVTAINTPVDVWTNPPTGPNNEPSWTYHDGVHDTGYVLHKTQRVADTITNLLTPPSPFWNEILMILMPGSAQTVSRQFHTYNTGWSTSFENQNSMGAFSPDGRFYMWLSDGYCQLGNTSGGGTSVCGGPDWSSSATYAATPSGSKIGPPSKNSGNYAYQVQSCVGGVCTQGNAEPDWSTCQTASCTIGDGTITWVNIGAVNSRTDILVGEVL